MLTDASPAAEMGRRQGSGKNPLPAPNRPHIIGRQTWGFLWDNWADVKTSGLGREAPTAFLPGLDTIALLFGRTGHTEA